MKRTTIAALGLVVGATAGCMDMGLEGNIPLEEAQDRQPKELVAAVMRPTEAVAEQFVVDGRLWLPSGLPLTLQAAELRAIGSADGRTLHARAWDEPPYDALFVRLTGDVSPGLPGLGGESWIELQPVLGRTGPVPPPGADAPGGAAHDPGGH